MELFNKEHINMLLLQAHNKEKCQTMSEILQIKVAQIESRKVTMLQNLTSVLFQVQLLIITVIST